MKKVTLSLVLVGALSSLVFAEEAQTATTPAPVAEVTPTEEAGLGFGGSASLIYNNIDRGGSLNSNGIGFDAAVGIDISGVALGLDVFSIDGGLEFDATVGYELELFEALSIGAEYLSISSTSADGFSLHGDSEFGAGVSYASLADVGVGAIYGIGGGFLIGEASVGKTFEELNNTSVELLYGYYLTNPDEAPNYLQISASTDCLLIKGGAWNAVAAFPSTGDAQYGVSFTYSF